MTSQSIPQFTTPPQNMVQVVENIVQGYDMGAIRALAQEPVQNSIDASSSSTVHVEYRLHSRQPHGYMLTVTDWGTKGLGGPVLTPEEFHQRNRVLDQDHDWAAFEGQGYTKTNEDALGSRGQGKAAFLYNSDIEGSTGQRRMAMVYDTLLPSGEYRLGVRYARPDDGVRTPPLTGTEAQAGVRSDAFVIDETFLYALCLSPLKDVGTRVIVPWLSREAVSAFRSGELRKWLQLLWWRAIQTDKVGITLKDEYGGVRTVEVPDWWVDEPWKSRPLPSNILVAQNVPVPEYHDYQIKRLVLLHDPALREHRHLYERSKPEFDGVQIMRGMQWIETRSSRSDFDQYIPKDSRAGFRGFVEFEGRLDRELRGSEYEKPQHDGYDGRKALIRNIRREIESHVERFASEQGWLEPTKAKATAQDSERAEMQRVLKIFVQPESPGSDTGHGEGSGGTTWEANVQVDYPDPGSTRVNYGQSLKRLYVRCGSNPPLTYGSVKVSLSLVDPTGKRTPIADQEARLKPDGSAEIEFGDFLVYRDKSIRPHLRCEAEGKYQVLAEAELDGELVAKRSRVIYVQQDPPEPPAMSPVTMSIEAVNDTTPERKRINDNELLSVRVRLTNRTNADLTVWPYVTLVASELPGYLQEGFDSPSSWQFVDANMTGPVLLRGTPLGERPEVHQLPRATIRLITEPNDTLDQAHAVLAPGRHSLNVNVHDESGGIKISRSPFVYFEVDPPGTGAELPFQLRRHAEESQPDVAALPNWWMTQENGADGPYIVNYAATSPMYQVAERVDRDNSSNEGTSAFVAEIVCDALIDWACKETVEHDHSKVEMLTRGADIFANPNQARWEYLRDQIKIFVDKRNDGSSQVEEMSVRRRRIVANMVRLAKEVARN